MSIMLDDETIAQLFMSLLWQATDDEGNPLDSYYGYDRSDIAVTDQEELIERFRTFVGTYGASINDYMRHTNRDMADVAHDYILTCNGHGAGFWDRCNCREGMCWLGDALTTACKDAGEINVYRSDDGELVIES